MNAKVGNELSGNMGVTYYIGGCTNCGSWWGSDDIRCKFSKLYFPVEGEMEIEIEGQKMIGRPGDLFLIPEGVKHSFRLTEKEKLKKYWFHFNLFPIVLKNAFRMYHVPYAVHISGNKKVEGAFQRVLTLANEQTLISKIKLQAQIFDLLAVFFENAVKNGAEFQMVGNAQPSLSFIAQYMVENMSKNITLEELATLANLHPNYLIRSFKQQFGATPVKYLNDMRLEKIIALICNSNLPFKEIMQQTGFTEPAYFSGFFRQRTGYSPREYRKYHREHQAPPPSKVCDAVQK